MKKILIFVAMLFLLGCSAETKEMDRGLAFRQSLLNANGCSFETEITADFGDETYTFTLGCQGRPDGSMTFTVEKPDTISGIGGELSAAGGKITFDDDRAVAFPMLAEGEATPVSGPWILYNALRGGYILAYGMEEDLLRLTINDTYEEEAFQVDVWLDEENRPVMADVFWKGRRILSMYVRNFQIL